MRILTVVFIFTILLFAVGAWAEPVINVTFPEKGGYIYWLEGYAVDEAQMTVPAHISGEDAEIDLAPAAKDGALPAGSLVIYNPKTGNVCSKSLSNLEGKTDLVLKDKDFDLVRTVRIVLRPQKGKPNERIESALVTLTDANSDKFTVVVDPSSEGTAEFHNVAAGTVNIAVAYAENKTMTLDIDVPLERDDPVFTDELAVSSKVRTVKLSGTEDETKEGSAKKETSTKGQRAAGGVSWLQYVMSLVLLAMLGFVGYVVLKARGATFESSLKKLGVQFPQDADSAFNVPAQAPEPQIDPNVCQFCGQQKDANGKCSCTIDGPLPGAGSVPASATGIPRLIGIQGQYMGHIFEITGSEATLGRDPGNTIALTEDGTSSRRHARIAIEGGSYSVTDEGSSNGTFVNGIKITGQQPLQPGDEVQIGSTKFRFEV